MALDEIETLFQEARDIRKDITLIRENLAEWKEITTDITIRMNNLDNMARQLKELREDVNWCVGRIKSQLG